MCPIKRAFILRKLCIFLSRRMYPKQDMYNRPQLQHCTLCCKRLTRHMLKNIMIMLVILTSGVNWKKTKIHNLNSGVWNSGFSYHLLCVVRSLRERDFHLYIQVLQKIVPLMFALDHPNYARWLPVHIRDMMLLEKCHLDVAAEFKKGNFVV